MNIITKATEPRVFLPHRRRSFGPENSVNLADFLHKGFEVDVAPRRFQPERPIAIKKC
jgi:hypothetical protein